MWVQVVAVCSGACALTTALMQSEGKSYRLKDRFRNVRVLHNGNSGFIRRSSSLGPNEDAKLDSFAIKLRVVGVGLAGAGLFYFPLSLLSLPVLWLGNWRFMSYAVRNYLRTRKATVDTLVAVSLICGILISSFSMLAGQSLFLFLASLNYLLIVLSREMVKRVKRVSKKRLTAFCSEVPANAWVIRDGVEIEVAVDSLRKGELIAVAAGQAIPVDGRVEDGNGSVDQRMMTGEAVPAEKLAGDDVFASTLVLSGRLVIAVERAGAETTVAQIEHVLNNTVNYRARSDLWAESVVDRSVIPTICLSGLCFPILGAVGAWSILLLHPKHKTAGAASLSIMTHFRHATRRGILIKTGLALEALKGVDTFVFDKTGTLTLETSRVAEVHLSGTMPSKEVVRFAAAVEIRQDHPVAKALVAKARELELELPSVSGQVVSMGFGVRARIEERLIRVGSHRFLRQEGLKIPDCHEEQLIQQAERGRSAVFIAVDGEVVGMIELEPVLRPGAREAISGLKQRGIREIRILSGDQPSAVAALAREVGIAVEFSHGGVLPQEKASFIRRLQTEGRTVCFVGDGLNDGIALKEAAVSISLRGASSLALDSAQILLMGGSLGVLPELIDLARSYERNMKHCFFTVFMPHFFGLGGVLFLGYGLLSSILLANLGLLCGLFLAANPTLPRSGFSLRQTDNGLEAADRQLDQRVTL